MTNALFLLFLSAFTSATVLPGSSEAVLVGVLTSFPDELWLPIGIATVGNTGGSVVNWVMGRFLAGFANRKWFPLTEKQHERASRWFRRYGVWSLLLAWLPVIGDPITIVAGLMRVSILWFVILVGIVKGLRYVFVAGAVFAAT